jgi:hypothetical protein
MEYGRSEPHIRADSTGVVASGGPARLTLTSPVTLRCGDGAARGRFAVSAGETVEFRLDYEPSFGGGRTGEVECLALAGEVERAEQHFRAALGFTNDLGLMSEEADVGTGELLGNFPQAFSHVGLINAAWRLTEAARSQTHAPLSTKETS